MQYDKTNISKSYEINLVLFDLPSFSQIVPDIPGFIFYNIYSLHSQ